MNTPIVDFVKKYSAKNRSRLHMPGHKGKGILGVEKWDITEIEGADSLYEAIGIIKESEQNATKLFGTKATFYSTEGSSQCIKAMLYLALSQRGGERANLILATRNSHKAFLHAAALLDFEIHWLYPKEFTSLCSCVITAEELEEQLKKEKTAPAAVYVTSPDYLGSTCDVKALADVCHKHGTLLIVDNAHGAYTKFLKPSQHPIDLCADMCCDSAHKTLPVLTGGAYLHLSVNLDDAFVKNAKNALGIFGSTSPSYLILASLDCCNKYLSQGYDLKLEKCVNGINNLKEKLMAKGIRVMASDPLKLTVFGAEDMRKAARDLEKQGVYCEYADKDYLVLMFTPENSRKDFKRVFEGLKELKPVKKEIKEIPLVVPQRAVSVRNAFFASSEKVKTEEAKGKICACPTVSCPPAIPIVISGEIISESEIELFKYYGIDSVAVVKE